MSIRAIENFLSDYSIDFGAKKNHLNEDVNFFRTFFFSFFSRRSFSSEISETVGRGLDFKIRQLNSPSCVTF